MSGVAVIASRQPAVASWEKAEQADPDQPNAHLYLAQWFDQRAEPADAAREWKAFLRTAPVHTDDPTAGAVQQSSAAIQLADDETRIGDAAAANSFYLAAIAYAQQADDPKLESLAHVHLADLQERAGDVKSAANSYQRGLALDEKLADTRSAAFDWFNYGQFLRRHGAADELAYARFVHAQALMAGASGEDTETVKSIRRQIGTRLGKKAGAAETNLPTLLARAAQLPADSFQ